MPYPAQPSPPPDLTSRALHIAAGLAIPAVVLFELRAILRAIVWLAGA